MRRRRQGVSVKCKSALAKFVAAERNALPSATTQKIWRRSLVGYSGRFIPGRSLVRIRSPLPLWSNPLGSLAQLVRAPALQAGGHRFESCSFHQLIQIEYTALWSSGLRHRPFTAVTRVRTSVGSPKKRHSNECLFLFPTEIGYFISARCACRTLDTRLTASEERRKRKAFADIERGGHSKQIDTKCPCKARLCDKHNLFSVDRGRRETQARKHLRTSSVADIANK